MGSNPLTKVRIMPILKTISIAFWLLFAVGVLIGLWHSFFTNEDNDHDQ